MHVYVQVLAYQSVYNNRCYLFAATCCKKTFFIRTPQGPVIICNVNSEGGKALSDLKCEICSITGIPVHVQHLYGQKSLGSETLLHALPDQSNISLNIKLLGGQNECEVCFGAGEYYCTDCEQYLCNECSFRVHRHPKWALHTPNSIVLESAPQTETSGPMETSMDSLRGPDDEYDMELSGKIIS